MDNADQIRATATHLFAQHGYEGVSLQAIAERVGVTKQTLLYHYSSKDVLRRAVLDGVIDHWRRRLPQMLEAFTSGHGRFEALTRELITFFESDTDRAMLIMREVLDDPDQLQRLMGESLRPWVLLVSQYIREGQRIDLIYDDVDAEAYVLNVILLVLTHVVGRTLTESLLAGDSTRSDSARDRWTNELFRMTRTALFKR